MKITSGSDDVWASRQCPKLLAAEAVVLRADRDLHGHRALVGPSVQRGRCTDYNAWAAPGYYHVVAAAFGGEPTDVQFHLLNPATRRRGRWPTRRPEGSPRAKEQKSADQQKKADEQGKAQQKKAQRRRPAGGLVAGLSRAQT